MGASNRTDETIKEVKGEDDEADLCVVPEEVMDGECERSTTVMMVNKKSVNNDSI